MEYVKRVLITEAATKIIDELKQQHGDLMFHQSGGCCDGSAPMCYPKGDFIIGKNDVWLGSIHDCSFYMNQDQFEYWKHTQLTVDITQGRGSSFSLEIPLGLRFIIQSRLFNDDEITQLEPIHFGE